MTTDSKTDRYLELDALRGIAAVMVVFFHFAMKRPEAELGFKLGITGVDLFFIISGFVILMSLNKVTKSIDFVINRVSRLYPTYWASVTFTFLLLAMHSIFKNQGFNIIDIARYVGNMTMFQFYLKIQDLDGPYWSMIIEMLFYLVMLFLFHFKLLNFLNIIGISLSILVVIAANFSGDHVLVKNIISEIPLLQFIPLFLAGTVFYKIYTSKDKVTANYFIIIFCLLCQILLFKYSGRSHSHISHAEYAVMLIIYFGLFALFVNDKLKFIVTRGTLFLGKISFALYLTHQYLSREILIPILTDTLNIDFWIASFAISFPIAILVASGITYYVEVPFGKIMKEKLRTINKASFGWYGRV